MITEFSFSNNSFVSTAGRQPTPQTVKKDKNIEVNVRYHHRFWNTFLLWNEFEVLDPGQKVKYCCANILFSPFAHQWKHCCEIQNLLPGKQMLLKESKNIFCFYGSISVSVKQKCFVCSSEKPRCQVA